MKVLLVGGGGREHAIASAISRSPLLKELVAAPGNPGIGRIARLVPIPAHDIEGLVQLARSERFDLTVIGPEQPLAAGLVDRLQAEGLLAFGPTAAAAELEASKAFAKDLMARHGIPTASFKVFEKLGEAMGYLEQVELPVVIKADGLAAGKGVVIARERDEARKAAAWMMADQAFGASGSRLVIEAFLEGEEASFLAIADGSRLVPLASSQDHKTAFDGDTGPNTGGMGAISPTPLVTDAVSRQVMTRIMEPVLLAMAAMGREFRGVLYAGLMIKDGEARVLEFNARFGDPETEAILPRLDEDLLPILIDAAAGRLNRSSLAWRPEQAATVVMAARGYPGTFRRGMPIHGLEDAEILPGVTVFQAGTSWDGSRLVTAGGRVLAVTGLGIDMREATRRAYTAVERISWDEVHYRRDIGHRALGS
jgi:phosphoribosylamine--glycine ligase